MKSVEKFAAEVARFRNWTMSEQPDPKKAVEAALVRLSSLYLAALPLPLPLLKLGGEDQLRTQGSSLKSDNECDLVALRQIPFDFYAGVFAPLSVPGDESVVGSLFDDVADIHRDISVGLLAYHRNAQERALWEWRFGFYSHWGKHATGAISALHAWIAAEEAVGT